MTRRSLPLPVEIRAPIFVVGCPRSGTSVFYEKLAQHPDLAWISRATKRAPSSPLLTRLLLLFRKDTRPTEAKKVWDRFGLGDDHALGREDATAQARRYFERVMRTHLAIFRKKRFLSKCPRNSLRIEYFDALFPDAIFIHTIRDGRAVVNSLMRCWTGNGGKYWGAKPPGWRELLGRPLLEACALQWKLVTEHALKAAEKLPRERYVEVRYEDFTARPVEVLNAVAEKCGLVWDQQLLKSIVGDIQSRDYKWRQNFRPEDIARLNELAGDLLLRLGYQL